MARNRYSQILGKGVDMNEKTARSKMRVRIQIIRSETPEHGSPNLSRITDRMENTGVRISTGQPSGPEIGHDALYNRAAVLAAFFNEKIEPTFERWRRIPRP